MTYWQLQGMDAGERQDSMEAATAIKTAGRKRMK